MMMWESNVNQVYDAFNNIATEIIATNIIFMLKIIGPQLLKIVYSCSTYIHADLCISLQ